MNKKIIVLILLFVGIISVIFYLKKKYAFGIPQKNSQEVQIIENISYIDDNNPKHRLDVYLPKDKKNFPVLHFVHGGYWVSGDKNYFAFATGLYGNIGTTLAKNGIGVVVQNYRLAPETQIQGQLEDVLSGIDWTTKNISQYGGSPNKVYLMGHSAGGHIVTLLGTNTSLLAEKKLQQNIAGFIDLSGILDIPDMVKNHDDTFNKEISFPVFGTDIAIQKQYSPTTYITDSLPNFLVIVGEHDFPLINTQTETMIHSLTTKAPYHILSGQSHIDIITQFGKTTDTITPLILDFVNSHNALQ